MTGTDTPLMQQWREAKARHPDALVFFRVGDFFELFRKEWVLFAEFNFRVMFFYSYLS